MTAQSPRATPPARRVPQIDGLRALGMLMVYLFHVREFTGATQCKWQPALLGGHTDLLRCVGSFGNGVDLFMVISGFCLFWPLCSPGAIERWDLAQYFRRRVRRIVPPYYAAIGYTILVPVLLVALYRLLGRPANWQPIPGAWQLFTHFLFIHALFPSTWNGITGAFWSLSLEAQFYVLFPLAVFAYRRFGAKAIWYTILASVAFRVVVSLAGSSANMIPFILALSSPGRWMEFGFGMLTALYVSRHSLGKDHLASPAAGTLQIVAAAAIYAIATFLPSMSRYSSMPLYEVLLSVAFSLLIIALSTSHTPLARLFTNPVANWLGGISYSLYLLHQPTAWYLSEFLKKQLHIHGLHAFWLLATAGFLVVLAVSYPFYLIFERPGLRRNDPAKKSPQDPPPPPAQPPPRRHKLAHPERPKPALPRLDCR
jgi:peptidoglycan/LPS O-acetylase OafA/YrhL